MNHADGVARFVAWACRGRLLPLSGCDRLVIYATALLRYLPEALCVQLGHSSSWRCDPPTPAVCWLAEVGEKVVTKDRLVLHANSACDPLLTSTSVAYQAIQSPKKIE
jgi:hypothetical protein